MPQLKHATDARVHFGELLSRVDVATEPVTVEKSGHPAAVIISPERFEELKCEPVPSDWFERAKRSSELVAIWLNGQPLPDIDDMINFGHDVD